MTEQSTYELGNYFHTGAHTDKKKHIKTQNI